jgi:hypothetical protein
MLVTSRKSTTLDAWEIREIAEPLEAGNPPNLDKR